MFCLILMFIGCVCEMIYIFLSVIGQLKLVEALEIFHFDTRLIQGYNLKLNLIH